MTEVKNPLAADNVFGPVEVDKSIEFMKIERSATEIYIRAYAIFLSFTFSMMVMMVVTMFIAMMPRLTMFRSVIMMVVVMLMLVMVMMMLFLDLFLSGTFDFLNPCCGGRHILKVETVSIDNVIKMLLPQ